MSTKTLHLLISENDSHNLSLIQQLYNHNPNFESYAKSITALFYYYLHHCTEQDDEFSLNTDDVKDVLELVHTLTNLKQPTN
ncbi:hypothetical protein [Myroides sp. DF42-4-2]|uniref:hypothetical protein n=1 Tax=unclassified Myroides TaxID=2642485 RepID=UPI002577249A|nr:hypothetical protein [Myroides sp. DF42-4-2]MDM1406152.1 hypothetical protein [Myroides sp. DF42-4-2]